ncbi:glycosyl hydrolase 53 family protein [Pelagicoccus sp. SDUM812005]|uniref:glycoside hydrolase family 53 protein n=1 Tax=Pelagicoccus sp. SDUM812005 TaxID=3041257 RepID=UPI00280E4A3C|nr:glycosyl hydrolase 53 family protein [Pelagicoccus sp. SDUM812005]MDQ8179157.1 glycosyl hydrolase 53 family protein [Pelagicoccus sp. SDUM812005]
MKVRNVLSLGIAFAAGFLCADAEVFYFGNDLSYVNQMEDCGAVFREGDAVVDPFVNMAEHGTNLVRVRLWNDPYWQEDIPRATEAVKAQYSNLEDVTKTIRRSKEAGMAVALDFHFSDFWADPGRQVIPRDWGDVAADDDALAQRLYEYVVAVLDGLDADGLMPEIVTLGNESNSGILLQDELHVHRKPNGFMEIEGGGTWRDSDERLSKLWNAGIRAVRECGQRSDIDPKIALHVADPNAMLSFFDRMTRIGITDFDLAGISYYYAWHKGSIREMGDILRAFKAKYPQYGSIVLETGYPWDTANIDGLANIISDPDPQYLPLSPEMQRRYYVDLTQEVIDAGGVGVVVWEPLWVSTPCRTPWGTGSSHEHVAYYDHRDNNNLHAGGTWMEADYTGLRVARPVAVSNFSGAQEGRVEVAFGVSPGSEYQIERSDDLRDWKASGSLRPQSEGEAIFTIELDEKGSSFARVWKLGE